MTARPTGSPARGAAPATQPDAWRSYSLQQQIGVLSDLAAGADLHLRPGSLFGYSRNMQNRLQRRAGDVARFISQHFRIDPPATAAPWRWAQLTGEQQAQRLHEISDWARWHRPTPQYDAGTRQLYRELAAAATVMADRLQSRPWALER